MAVRIAVKLRIGWARTWLWYISSILSRNFGKILLSIGYYFTHWSVVLVKHLLYWLYWAHWSLFSRSFVSTSLLSWSLKIKSPTIKSPLKTVPYASKTLKFNCLQTNLIFSFVFSCWVYTHGFFFKPKLIHLLAYVWVCVVLMYTFTFCSF